MPKRKRNMQCGKKSKDERHSSPVPRVKEYDVHVWQKEKEESYKENEPRAGSRNKNPHPFDSQQGNRRGN